MHICFLTNEYPKEGFPHGGLGSFVKTIAEALVEKGIQVTVLGFNYEFIQESENLNGVQVVRLKKSNIKGLAWFFNSRKLAKSITAIHRKQPIDVVEGAELAFAFLPKIKGLKYVIRLHGGHHFFAEAEQRGINWWKGFQEKLSFKKADAFIAVSNYVKTHTAQYLSYGAKPISVIFNPIHTALFYPRAIAVVPHSITFAGTICEKKGVRQLLQSFARVKEQFPSAVLNLYGRDWFYPNGDSYIKMLQKNELPNLGVYANDVIFHGAIPFQELPFVYTKSAVCVFPSHMETLGLVAPEAMACEKPVVFTTLGPGKEVVTNGVDGIVINPYDPEEIAEAIISIFSDMDSAHVMGKKARMTVLEKFDPNIIVNQNIAFYSSL